MTDIKYVVEITHSEKGIGFLAKDALQSAQRAGGGSLVKQARFAEPPTGSVTKIEVVVDEAYVPEHLSQILVNSGRLHKGHYEIKSISVVSDEATLRQRVEELEGQYRIAQRDTSSLREENTRLRAAVKPVGTPLEGIIKYFDTLDLKPQTFLEDAVDYDFGRLVSAKATPNTFANYVKQVLGTDLGEEQIKAVLGFDPQSANAEFAGLETLYRTALEELVYMQRLEEGSVDMPLTLREDTIKIIKGKTHEAIIKNYEARRQELDKNAELHQILTRLQEKYQKFAEHLELLEVAADEIPVAFNMTGSGVQIYFPFKTRAVRTGFIEDLGREISSYFGGAKLKTLPYDYVAFEVAVSNVRIAPVVEDMPFTLKASGFNRIIPYVLGRVP